MMIGGSCQIIEFLAMKDMPNKIRQYRKARGWTLEELGLRVGCSHATIFDLEAGKLRLSVEWMRKLSQAMSTDEEPLLPSDLMLDSDRPDGLTDDERKMLALMRRAAPEQRAQMIRVNEAMIGYTPEPDLAAPPLAANDVPPGARGGGRRGR